MISFKHIESSYNRIKNYVNLTPILESQKLNEITNSRILIKAECLQKTGSFKIRGAMNMISQIKNNNTVVAPSSGNHAQGVASAANYLNFSSTLVMPRDAPKTKINGVKSYGGKIHFYDRHNEDRFKIAQKIAHDDKSILIPPYDHPDIIAGQGTIGFEIINQLSKTNFIPDTIFCCCGGGGLIAGLALSINHKWPKTKIHPVEPLGWDDTKTSLQKGVRVKATKKHSSICDALLAETPGELTFSINKKMLSEGLVVNNQQVLSTIKFAFEELKLVVEPGGAVALSAAIFKKDLIKNKNVLVIISGGNVDINIFKKALETKG